jgi:hypothetical protein
MSSLGYVRKSRRFPNALFCAKSGAYLRWKERAKRREVEIDHRNRTEAEILNGISAGEDVILHPFNQMRDGVCAGAQ